MASDMISLADTMREAAGRGRGVEDCLQKMFAAGYAFYKTQLPLARAAFSVGWSPQDGPVLRNAPGAQVLRDLTAEQLALGVKSGELSQEAEVKLRAQMVFDAYLSNYPLAIFDGWSLEALQARSRDQIRILLAGARRG
jgi:hypothetical protein